MLNSEIQDGQTKEILVSVDRIYPGMEQFVKEVVVKNKGEMDVQLEYEITSITFLNEVIEVNEENGITSEMIEQTMKSDLPFKININKTNDELKAQNGEGKFIITIDWEFDGDDNADTEWGEGASEFYKLNPDGKLFALKIKLVASQLNK